MKWYLKSNALLVTFLFGCTTEFVSIHSRQFSFLRDHLVSDKRNGPQPSWILHWLGEERPVYAINSGEQVLFANESGDLLRFKDRQIVEVRNLLPGDKTVTIRQNSSGLEYAVNQNLLEVHACRPWQITYASSAHLRFIQHCNNEEGRYSNHYEINKLRQLTKLSFVIHPAFPPVVLNLVPQ